MEILVGGLTSIFGGGGAAAATAAGTTAAASTGLFGTGLSLGSLLQGTATVLGVVSSIGAANGEAAQAELAASDADGEQNLETLQGIERRTSIRRQVADAIGAQDVANAASGVDLSFGTAAAARNDAFREGDLALTGDAGTEQTRVSRLMERARNYRSQAKSLKRFGIFNAFTSGLKGFQAIADRGM